MAYKVTFSQGSSCELESGDHAMSYLANIEDMHVAYTYGMYIMGDIGVLRQLVLTWLLDISSPQPPTTSSCVSKLDEIDQA